MMKRITTPINEETRLSLRAGEEVIISGKIYTGRDAAHKRFVEHLSANGSLPFDFNEQIIYYTGPTPEKPGMPIGACGPTSSYRMDPYSIQLMPMGMKIMIGKGERDKAFQSKLVETKSVYLIAIGGIGAILSKTVKSSKTLLYEDLSSEAVRELEVVDFPVIVAYDACGNSIFK
ncbi:MAG: FumA C-terminus/TtdB family hydratase beta subunit [Firmicutes bacterium]|nr:FumA C-terminus/TtdB family hydratase beta subunit [Bacillota bacterium]